VVATHEVQETRRPLPAGAGNARTGFALGASLLVACVVLQVFFAGLGLMVDGDHMGLHRALGGVIGIFPMVMLPLGLLGRLPGRLLAATALLYLLYMLQYVFVSIPEATLLRAFHPVNALLFFWVSVRLMQAAWRLRQHG
jgi:hypothetical protein